MHNLFRCRRGSAAFATVVALVPLIGVVALGGEAGSWYVTKQHAQNAADAAAMAGGWRLKCSIIAQTDVNSPCTDTNSVDYRAKQFAAKNAFCNASDTSYPGSQCAAPGPGTSQSVTVAVGTDQVRATVSQQQPAYLAAVLGMSTVNIPATAVAKVQILTKPCILALKGSISFQGSPTLSSSTCGVASNSTAPNAFDFTGNGGINVTAPSFTAGGCSQTGGSQCNNVTTQAANVPNPLSGLDSAMSSLTTSNFSGTPKSDGSYASYESCGCYNTPPAKNKPLQLSGNLNGTYFFNGAVEIGNVTGTATLVLFGSATLGKTTGNPSIQLTAQTNPQVPPALSSVSNLMKGLLIYDPEPYSTKGVDISGNSSTYLNGTVYVPNAPLTYSGNSSGSTPNPGCFQVIAYAVKFSGNTKLDESGCAALGISPLEVQYVRLVQ
jgi:putative Flp pilus-assembly TadE/G-like protein